MSATGGTAKTRPGHPRDRARDRARQGLRAALACLVLAAGLTGPAAGSEGPRVAGAAPPLAQPLPVRTCADVALVLAIDASGSIDDHEFDLQRTGYVDAFRNAEVHVALHLAGVVDVAAVVWGDSDFAPHILPFHRIATADDAAHFATAMQHLHRTTRGNTGLGNGIDHALTLLADPAVCADRKIIDLSGDGRQVFFRGRNGMVTPRHARLRAAEMGVTINAIAILSREPDLEDYYRARVITGEGAFATRAQGFADFGAALIDKLVRELMAGLPNCGGPDCG